MVSYNAFFQSDIVKCLEIILHLNILFVIQWEKSKTTTTQNIYTYILRHEIGSRHIEKARKDEKITEVKGHSPGRKQNSR